MPRSLLFLAMFAFFAVEDAAADEIRKPRLDRFGDPLPNEAIARIGSSRLRHPGYGRISLAFSGDGKTLASGGKGVRLWDTATGKLQWRSDAASNRTLAFALKAEGVLIASAGSEKGIVTLQVFDLSSGTMRRCRELPIPSGFANYTLSHDGKWLAYVRRNEVRIHDTANGREVLRLPAGRGIARIAVDKIAFTPDDKSVIICDISDTVRVHDIASGRCTHRLQHEGDGVVRTAISADGRYLASIPSNVEQRGGEFSIWDLQTGKERHRLNATRGLVLSVAFSPDGKYVAVGCQDLHLLLFDMATGKEVRRYPSDVFFSCIAFSPDGKALAAFGAGAIRLWETATGRVLPASVDPFLGSIHEIRFSPDGRRLIGRAGGTAICFAWEPTSGRQLRRLPRVSAEHWLADLSPDESLFATTDTDGTIRLWNTKSGREVRALKGHGEGVGRTIFSADGRRLISNGYLDKTIRVWDVAGGREIAKLASSTHTSDLTVSPDGRWLATSSERRGARGYEIVLWELAAGREKRRLAMPPNRGAFQLAFSSNSRLLAAAPHLAGKDDPGEALVWDVNVEQQPRRLVGHKGSVFRVVFSPDNRTLATGDSNGEVFLWELASGLRRHHFVGHEWAIDSLAFSPDSRLLAASSSDAPAFVWDLFGVLDPRRGRLSMDELQRCWAELAGKDAAAAFGAIRRLAAVPEQTLPYLRQHLKPVPEPDRKRVRQLVEMLDSADFETRQKATEELENLVDASASTLRLILAKEKPSLEVRQRLQQILEGIESKPESLRAVRAVEVLEWIATPEAVRFIDELAKGTAEARWTREASSAQRRLHR